MPSFQSRNFFVLSIDLFNFVNLLVGPILVFHGKNFCGVFKNVRLVTVVEVQFSSVYWPVFP